MAPKSESEIEKGDYHADALEAYFAPLDLVKPKKPSLRKRIRRFIRADMQQPYASPYELADLKKRVRELEAERDALGKQLGTRSEKEKALTVNQAFTHAQFFLPCRDGASPIQRQNVLRRIGWVCEAIGLDRGISTLTKADIADAIQKTEPASELEAHVRKQAIKRFFDFLVRPTNEDGLALSQNPASNIEAGSVSKIQRGKQQRGEVEVLSPFAVLKPLDCYSSALVAVLAFAGLRLAEAAGLAWEMVDFDAKLIKVRASEHYPELKSIHSYRDIAPFPNVWPYLEALKKESNSVLVFPRVGETKKATWLDTYLGEVKQTYFSIWFRKTLETATGLELPEPALRLRRYWQTTMRENGHESLIQAMGGNDAAKVGMPHYAKWASLVAKAQIQAIKSED